jgi:hypothetical protein
MTTTNAAGPGLIGRIGIVLNEVVVRPDLVERIDALLQQIAARMEVTEPLTQPVQQCLGRLSTVLPYLPRLKNAEINVAQAELAVRALLSPKPEEDLAKAIVDDLVRRKRVYDSAFRSIVYGRTPATFVLLGVLTHAVVLVPLILGLSRLFPCGASAGAGSVCWVPLAIAGAVGGATSLLARLNKLAGLSRWSSEGDPLQLFYTGLLKPVVGIVAGLFAYAAFSSGLITVHIPGQGASPDVFYAALAFLAGFSERFARDLTDSASKLSGEE